jgi:hypothetical protein
MRVWYPWCRIWAAEVFIASKWKNSSAVRTFLGALTEDDRSETSIDNGVEVFANRVNASKVVDREVRC